MSRISPRLSIAAAAVAVCFAAAPAHAQVVNYSLDGTVANIPGLTGFVTSGADMTGLRVHATFSSGLSEILFWSTTGPGAGGVFGTGWSLSLSGDSFGGNWIFDFGDNANLQLEQLILDGTTGLTVFDRTEPNPGTPGSSQGMDFDFAGGTCVGCVANAIYGFETSVGPAAAVQDLYQSLTVNFIDGTGPRVDWNFVQDTDNDSRFVPGIPEPETYALMLGGLGLMGWLGRRRRKAGSK